MISKRFKKQVYVEVARLAARFQAWCRNRAGDGEPVWVDQNGRVIPYSELSDRHLNNILRIKRTWDETHDETYRLLVEEAVRRSGRRRSRAWY